MLAFLAQNRTWDGLNMETASKTETPLDRFDCDIVMPSRQISSLEEDVREGLLSHPRSLPPKYFYDDHGSQLFDRICDTPEYYVTRTEDSLLDAHARTIMRLARPRHIIELGSGASRKTRHLFDACEALGEACCYWPFDVCEGIMRESAERLTEAYPWLEVRALVGDYLAGLDHLPDPDGRRLFVFLGGTIGNFEAEKARAFLAELRHRMRPGDTLLLGADRVKDAQVLNQAYNDAQGVTAAFNLNVLSVLNRELGGDFELGRFRHHARYDTGAQQIEMYLVAEEDHSVQLRDLDATLDIKKDERILTEISRKFTPLDLNALLDRVELKPKAHFEPENGYFSLVLAEPA